MSSRPPLPPVVKLALVAGLIAFALGLTAILLQAQSTGQQPTAQVLARYAAALDADRPH